MLTRQEAIEFCLSLGAVLEDYPFHDSNWAVMRHKANRKGFAFILERQGVIWVNVKCDPNLTSMWRESFSSVVPAYHMNKTHWNSIILDGTIPEKDIQNMIYDSFQLTKQKFQ